MSPELIAAFDFIIRIVLDFYITVLLLRLILQQVRADFYNPISQAIVNVSNPLVRPLRMVIPGYAGIDIATLLLIFLIEAMKLFLLGLIYVMPELPGFLLFMLAEIGRLTVQLFTFTIIIKVILSWLVTSYGNPAIAILWQLTNPILNLTRRICPPVGGIDISPMLAIIFLQLIQILFIGTLFRYAAILS